jgi:hypothetical protein
MLDVPFSCEGRRARDEGRRSNEVGMGYPMADDSSMEHIED